MNNKYTPGPWKAFNASWCETFVTAPSTDNAICCLDINHATEESQETDEVQMAANARLIAAAPDLLEALIEQDVFLGVLAGTVPLTEKDTHRRISVNRDAVRAAIAKATGA
jgi:hypothetical protein